jgi:hypothetical protein
MHAAAVCTPISQRMLPIEMLREEEQNKRNQARGAEGALLFRRATIKVGKRRKQDPQRGTVLAFFYVELGNLYKATQFYLSINSALPFLECCIPFESPLL